MRFAALWAVAALALASAASDGPSGFRLSEFDDNVAHTIEGLAADSAEQEFDVAGGSLDSALIYVDFLRHSTPNKLIKQHELQKIIGHFKKSGLIVTTSKEENFVDIF